MKIDYIGRLRKLQSILPNRVAVLITSEDDVYYFSGIGFASDARLLITRKKAFIVSDSRYRQELSMLASEYSPVEIELDFLSTLKGICPAHIRELLVDTRISALEYQDISRAMKGCAQIGKELFSRIRDMRMIKDKAEIAILKKNFRLHKGLIKEWKKKIKGLREADASLLWRIMALEAGCDDVSFPAIVAVGKSSSFPHYKSGNRRITSNRALLFDSGIDRYRYKTDLTRMFFTDKMSQRYRDCLNIVQDAQNLAFSLIKPGNRLKDLDLGVRSFLKKYGLDGYFTHSLGHGIGLEIHEPPRVSSRSQEIIKPGMVFTIEPGIYFPGRFGIRMEDVVLVKENGYELL